MRQSSTSAMGLVDSPRVRRWAVLRRKRSVPHLERKLYHLLMGVACFVLYGFALTWDEALVVLSIVGGAFVALDLARLHIPKVNDVVLRFFGGMMRREELRGVTGNTFYVFGLLAVVLLFPKPVGLLAVLYLAVGDPVAAVVGTRYGRTQLWGGKSLEGALANFFACAIVTLLFAAFYLQLSPLMALALAVCGGVVATLVELLPIKLDDNLTIPVFSGAGLLLLGQFIPFL